MDAGLKALAGWMLTSSRTQNPWSGGYSFGPHRTGTGKMESRGKQRNCQAAKRWEFSDSLRALMRSSFFFQTNKCKSYVLQLCKFPKSCTDHEGIRALVVASFGVESCCLLTEEVSSHWKSPLTQRQDSARKGSGKRKNEGSLADLVSAYKKILLNEAETFLRCRCRCRCS